MIRPRAGSFARRYPCRNGRATNIVYVLVMQEETVSAEQSTEDQHLTDGLLRRGAGATTPDPAEGNLLDLRMRLDVARLEHPSRWGRLSR